MARTRLVVVEFPLGGLNKQLAYQSQPPYTTPLALNIWPIDPGTGRFRGGVRPGIHQISTRGNAPHHWCAYDYKDTTIQEGIAVQFADGTWSTVDGVMWTERITTSVTTNLASCAVYNQMIYQAACNATTLQATVLGGAQANLSNAGGGTAPTKCGIVLAHADRLWLMADYDNIHQIYASAAGDATDWDFDRNTSGGAWSNTGTESGQIGHAVIAGLSHDINTLLVGSPNSMYAILGNPRVGGTRRVSDKVGPLTNNSWCKGIGAGGQQVTYVLTNDGLYQIRSGSLTAEIVSKKTLPDELLGLSPVYGVDGNNTGDKIAVGYDHRWQMLHVAVDRAGLASDINYAYHIPTDSWWPTSYAITPHVLPTFPALQTDDDSSMLLMTSGGAAYQFQRDSAEEFDSYVWLGPFKLGDAGSEGLIHAVTGCLASGSDDVNWQVYVGDSVEEAFNSSAAFTGAKWTVDGWNYTQHPRRRGHAAFIKLYDVDNERWLLEEIVMELQTVARRRVG